ncbi:hypothetical protein AAFC00_007112 [Neodothiora populina]|uniref:Uncharacterized protein n=1 Tax=Neodothiora populina TaxID=2781224 RepID=A0ABR3PDJ0_9PEZI
MSKLSQPLKSLISASHARPNTTPAPKNIKSLFQSVAQSAQTKNVGTPAWLTIATATSMTLNSPESMLELYHTAVASSDSAGPVGTAEFMREVGLKCMCINGVPRVINTLGGFRAGLPEDVVKGLSTTVTRQLNTSNIEAVTSRGAQLWKSIYNPLHDKLFAKLGDSHPNLPVYILEAEYGALLADPSPNMPGPWKVGRVLTSMMAVSCLRSQTGVGPQVTSHVFGLRKAYADGSAKAEDEVKGGEWLASDEGSTWLLETVDRISGAIAEGQGTTFAPGIRAKL